MLSMRRSSLRRDLQARREGLGLVFLPRSTLLLLLAMGASCRDPAIPSRAPAGPPDPAVGAAVRSEGDATGTLDSAPPAPPPGAPTFPAAATSSSPPRFRGLRFGEVTVNDRHYTTDVVIDGGTVRERDKGPSKLRKPEFGGHTPLTLEEKLPWGAKILVIGIGMDGLLPVTEEVKEEALRRGVKLILLKTPEALEYIRLHYDEGLNAVLHVTC